MSRAFLGDRGTSVSPGSETSSATRKERCPSDHLRHEFWKRASGDRGGSSGNARDRSPVVPERLIDSRRELHEAELPEVEGLGQFDRLGRADRDAGVAIIRRRVAGARILLILGRLDRIFDVGVTMSTTCVVMTAAAGQGGLLGPVLVVISTMCEPQVAWSREDHGQDRHHADETDDAALRPSFPVGHRWESGDHGEVLRGTSFPCFIISLINAPVKPDHR